MDTYKDAVAAQRPVGRGRGAAGSAVGTCASVGLRHRGATGCSARWLVRARCSSAATRVVVLRRDDAPRPARCALDGTRGALRRRARRPAATAGLRRARARRVRGRHGLPPRRADDRRAPPTARRVSTFETNVRGTWMLLEACRACTAAARGRRLLRQGLRRPATTLPYREDFAAASRATPTTSRKAATDLIARSYCHTYGLPRGRHPLRQPLRRRRPELLAPHARGGRRASLAGPPRRSFAPTARPSATSSTWRTRSTAYLRHRRRAGRERRGGRGVQRGQRPAASVRRRRRARSARSRGPTSSPTFAARGRPAGEIDRQYVDASKLRELTGWAPVVDPRGGPATHGRVVPRASRGAAR